ncbi:tRNA pseudouridine(13) synthase TruD [Candidatus Woesearchaeota archaeon]|nr:tRNA pseudouridine(13) synthase TruD [Candidatus Woesearchaeota archaeon]
MDQYVLKHQPSDFIVKEQLSLSLTPQGPYGYVEVEKRDYAMLKAIRTIAQMLGVEQKQIGYAGTKDKHAITTQVISIKLSNRGSLKKRVEQFSHPDLLLRFVGYGDNPISLGDHEGNWFEITVRNIGRLPIPRSWYINYFDEQRFQKNNVQIGRYILQRRFEEACALVQDKAVHDYLAAKPKDCIGALRRMPHKALLLYVHAYQSYLWNTAVARCLEKEYGKNGYGKNRDHAKNIIRHDYSLGTLVFPVKDELISMKIPIAGFDAGQDCPDIQQLLREDGISLRHFIVREIPDISSEGGERAIAVQAESMAVGALEQDTLKEFRGKKKCTVRFFLPKAAYATMIIQQMFFGE